MLLYQTEDGHVRTRVQVRVLDETVWLSQRQLAELFAKDVRTVNEHIQNIFGEGELERDPVIRKFRITALRRAHWRRATRAAEGARCRQFEAVHAA